MLQERNHRSRYRYNLVWRNVHVSIRCRFFHWEVTFKSTFYSVVNEVTIFIDHGIRLCDVVCIFFFSSQVFTSPVYVYYTIYYLTIRSFDKAHVIHTCVHTQRRNQTNVWSFRSFNSTKTTVVGVVNVTYFETGTLS